MPHPKNGYHLKDGTYVPGVTTIIGRFKNSGGLLWWAYYQGQASERGEISSLYDKRDEAADAGTICHSIVERYIKGELSTANRNCSPKGEGFRFVPPGDETMKLSASQIMKEYNCSEKIAKKALQGFENFLNWWKISRLSIKYTEIQLVSERYKYGGCNDLIFETETGLAIGDLKTSNSIYPDFLIQVAAYKQLWDEHHPKEPITSGFHLLRFSKEHADFAHHYWSELDDAWEQFKLFRKAYELDKKLKKRL